MSPIPHVWTYCQNCPHTVWRKIDWQKISSFRPPECVQSTASLPHTLGSATRVIHLLRRVGSYCPSGARQRAPKSMPASPTSRAAEDEKTVLLPLSLICMHRLSYSHIYTSLPLSTLGTHVVFYALLQSE